MFAARGRTVVDPRAALLLGIPGICALLFEPARWLWRTWWDPAWASDGFWAAVVTAGLILTSLLSGRPMGESSRSRRTALGLIVATAAVRLAGRVLDVHVLGAAALAVVVCLVLSISFVMDQKVSAVYE